ncbi:protein of unknown function [Denitratisoma oestradiolicum]|uniref:Uncharacterized protein n=1 Tax=Denitratisoma oestradiolicum TaxID=311182 RepID=A0A6S6Y0Y1_9PROT|nr:protein of unknown function [Denitratisoma oestradiolicum]
MANKCTPTYPPPPGGGGNQSPRPWGGDGGGYFDCTRVMACHHTLLPRPCGLTSLHKPRRAGG